MSYPDNPVLAHVWRGGHVESQHRGAWVLVDGRGTVLDGAGDAAAPFFVRSSIKCLQALPLVESGGAERFGLGDADLALMLASHSGEPQHTQGVARLLEGLGLDEGALQCGAHPPQDPDTRASLAREGREPSALHNNCSGKHAGFLALARHLGEDPARYLDPASRVQSRVRRALVEVSGVPEEALGLALDGCSAPTYRLPLAALAASFARVTSPASDGAPAQRRAACERMTAAVAAHPELLAGRHGRLCTAIVEASGGRLFPKIGAEGVYAVGERGADRALAVKIDDGAKRALQAVVVALCRRLGLVTEGEYGVLSPWVEAPLANWVGREVGRIEVIGS